LRNYKLESGLLLGELPFVRLGEGTKTLVVLPGLGDAFQDVRAWAKSSARFYRPFARDFTLYFISRKRGMPAGYTIRQMARDYARALKEYIGPAHVMGISMGGYIAEDLAADYPEMVQRLIIASSSHRPGPNGPELGRRWSAWAREGSWHNVCREFASVTFNGYRKVYYEYLVPLFVRLRRQRPSHPSDFLISVQACLSHDATDRLAAIRAPTLVIAGTRDGFFPESLIRETAARIPDARLHLINGWGHGVFMERKRYFDRLVRDFINREGASCI
jgi:pimeloyl-ACP methyl ester carboxylesterase